MNSIALKLSNVTGDKLKAERLNERLRHELDQLKVEKKDLKERLDKAGKKLRWKDEKKEQELKNQVAFFEEKVERMQGENTALFQEIFLYVTNNT